MNADFTHLHVHSQFSLLDSCIRFDELFKKASADKMEAIALTDHGNLFGTLDFYLKAKEHGIKPIIGCEIYLAPGDRTQKGTTTSGDEDLAPYSTSRSGLQHLILLCMNEVGYQNLCHLVSSGYLEGFYYRPRLDKTILARYSEGLIATSACLKGEVAHQALLGDMDRAREALLWYQKTFEGRFYLELEQNAVPQQMVVNQRFMELSKDLGVPVIATADCHYLNKEDAFSQEVLMAIHKGVILEDITGEQLKTDEFYFKPQSVMKEEFSFCPEAISNTIEISKQCNFEFKFTDEKGRKIFHFPKFDPPRELTQVEYLCEIAEEGLKKRLKEREELLKHSLSPEEIEPYELRLARELQVINDMGFTGYFLIVSDFIRHAKETGIPVGPGRGSGVGSLVAYCLQITELDPLDHGLLFERFLNPERISLPDFDIDFCMDKRDKIIEYVSQKYGKDCVAQIITFGKLQARGVIRDVGRVFGMTAIEMDKIAKLVPETLNISLEEAFQSEARLRALVEKDPRMAQLFNVCRKLEGLGRHASIHASGLVISNRPMVEHCPLYRGKNDELVIQFDMNNADRIGLIKFDFLGLKTLTFLELAQRSVNERHKEAHLDLNKLTLADTKTYELLSKGDTCGIFQMESSGMQDLLKKVKPDCFGDIVPINALYRPGPMGSGMLDDYIGRKQGQIPIQYDFEDLKPILQETYGVIVYQEQVQQIAMKLASYTAGGADLLRRAMGKKKPEEMAKQKEVFLKGAAANKYDPVKADKVFELMAKFAGYGFNKSHAAAYAMITFQTAYLKAHFPVEFYAALLSIERENTDKITKYISDSRRHQIEILSPDINESETDFTVLSSNQIRFGLGAIKGVGEIAIDSMRETRKTQGPFKDLHELCTRANPRTVNKRVLEAFIKAGALDSFKIDRATLFAAVDEALDLGSQMQKTRDDNQPSFADLLGETEETFSVRKITYPKVSPWDRLLELKYEKDTIGFYLTGHPLDDCEEEIIRYTTTTLADCQATTSSKDVFVGVTVVSLREILTKRGDRMAFATLEDRTGQLDAVIFSDVFLEAESCLKEGAPLWVKGVVECGEGGNKLILSKKNNAKVLALKYAYEFLAREIHVHLPIAKEYAENTFKILQSRLKEGADSRGVPIFFHMSYKGQSEAILKLKETIRLNRKTVNSIREVIHEISPDKTARIEFR